MSDSDRFDPYSFYSKDYKHWGWFYILLFAIPLLIILALTFYVLSLLVTDEDLYYKKQIFDHEFMRSTLSREFSKIEVVGEILPHFILANENDKYLRFEFFNNTYFKNMTYEDGEHAKLARFEELYFYTEDTKDELPHFHFDERYIPIGDSKSSCFHVKYRSKEKPVTSYENFTPLQNMQQCQGHKEEVWRDNDPVTGINLLVWKEFANEHRGDCSHGIFKQNTCYEYVVLDKICIIIRPVDKDPTKGWQFFDGCYEGGSSIQYKKAQPGNEYIFEDVPIEIWTHRGPFYEYEDSSTAFGADLSYFGWLSRMCWMLLMFTVISLIIFTCWRLCVTPPKEHEHY